MAARWNISVRTRFSANPRSEENTTSLACVPAGVLIVGGLDEQVVTVTQVEVFPQDQRLQQLTSLEHTEFEPTS